MKALFIAIASFFFYGVSVIVGGALSAGSSFQEGITHALLFGTFFVLVTFPILAGIGFFLRWVTERSLRRRLRNRSILPWLAHVPISLAFLYSAIPDSPETLFRRYVADDVPSSLTDVRYWRSSGFGNSITVMSFQLEPSEFPKVLSRYDYVERSDRFGNQRVLLDELIEGRPDFPILPPREPLVFEYSYSEPGPGGGLHVTHYSTKNKDYVVTIKTFD